MSQLCLPHFDLEFPSLPMRALLLKRCNCDAAAKVPLATHKDIDEAIDAAVAAAPAMAAMAAYERKAVLEKVSDHINAQVSFLQAQ